MNADQSYSSNVVEKLSEKGRRSLQCSLTEHQKDTFRPILASLHRLYSRSECCSYPFFGQFLYEVG